MHRSRYEKRFVVILYPHDYDERLRTTDVEAARAMLLPADEMMAEPCRRDTPTGSDHILASPAHNRRTRLNIAERVINRLVPQQQTHRFYIRTTIDKAGCKGSTAGM